MTVRWVQAVIRSLLQEETPSPGPFKETLIYSLLKKLLLDPTCLNNLCPVFLKILERLDNLWMKWIIYTTRIRPDRNSIVALVDDLW